MLSIPKSHTYILELPDRIRKKLEDIGNRALTAVFEDWFLQLEGSAGILEEKPLIVSELFAFNNEHGVKLQRFLEAVYSVFESDGKTKSSRSDTLFDRFSIRVNELYSRPRIEHLCFSAEVKAFCEAKEAAPSVLGLQGREPRYLKLRKRISELKFRGLDKHDALMERFVAAAVFFIKRCTERRVIYNYKPAGYK